ncbi:MAG: hypothetical protein ACYTF6_05415, partial [Planctomycetota bacterium]
MNALPGQVGLCPQLGAAGRGLALAAVLIFTTAASHATTTKPAQHAGAQDDALTRGIIKLTEGDWKAWQATVQQRHRLLEPIFYIVLKKTAALPALSDEQFEELDLTSYKSLSKDPNRYARVPVQGIRIRVKVGRVCKLRDKKLNREAWKMICYDAAAKVAERQPIIVYWTADPSELLPRPQEVI